MTPTSSLGSVILGELARRSMTGYDLARRMDVPIGYFWIAPHSQIYRELARLEDDGFVTHEVVDGSGPRDTKRYSITAEGLASLHTFVTTDMGDERARDLESAQIWSAWTVSPESALDLVDRLAERNAARLTIYEANRDEVASLGPFTDPSAPIFATWMVLDGAVRVRRARRDWYAWMRDQLIEVSPPQ